MDKPTTTPNKLVPFDASLEVKAHVYQQLTHLEKYSVPPSAMVVLMRKSTPTSKGNSTYLVDLVVSLGESRLESSGRARNVFEAVKRAKVDMEAQLSAVQNSLVSSKQREIEIQALLDGGSNLIH